MKPAECNKTAFPFENTSLYVPANLLSSCTPIFCQVCLLGQPKTMVCDRSPKNVLSQLTEPKNVMVLNTPKLQKCCNKIATISTIQPCHFYIIVLCRLFGHLPWPKTLHTNKLLFQLDTRHPWLKSAIVLLSGLLNTIVPLHLNPFWVEAFWVQLGSCWKEKKRVLDMLKRTIVKEKRVNAQVIALYAYKAIDPIKHCTRVLLTAKLMQI